LKVKTGASSIDRDRLCWECPTKTDQRRMEDWVNEELEEKVFEWSIQQHRNDTDAGWELGATMAEHALRRYDFKSYHEWVFRYPEIRKLMELSRLPRRRGRGRPRGTRGEQYNLLAFASMHVDLVREIWKKRFNKCNRRQGQLPTATGIVVRRFHRLDGVAYDNGKRLTEEALIRWRQDHGKAANTYQ